jgi:hypothetical protein
MTTASPDELVRASGYVRLLPRPQAATVIGHAIGGDAAVEFEVGRDGAGHDDIRGDLASYSVSMRPQMRLLSKPEAARARWMRAGH